MVTSALFFPLSLSSHKCKILCIRLWFEIVILLLSNHSQVSISLHRMDLVMYVSSTHTFAIYAYDDVCIFGWCLCFVYSEVNKINIFHRVEYTTSDIYNIYRVSVREKE